MNIINKVVGFISNIVDDTASIADTIEDITHANETSEADQKEDQQRRRATQNSEVDRTLGRRYRPSDVEKRLLPHYAVPRDATPLIVLEDNDWKPRGHFTMPGPSFQYRNTLNDPSAQAGTTSANGRSITGHSPRPSSSRARGPSRLSTTASAGQNVPKRKGFAEHEAAEESESSSAYKRTKLSSGGNAEHTVASTHYNYPFGEPVGVLRHDGIVGPLDAKTIQHSKKSGQDNSFSAGEMSQVNANLGLGMTGKKRRRISGRNSMRPASQSSMNDSSERASSSRRNDTVHVLDDDQRHFNPNKSPRAVSYDHDRTIPAIELTRGFEEISSSIPKKAPESGFRKEKPMRSTNEAPHADARLATEFKRDPQGSRAVSRVTAPERMRRNETGLGHRGSSPDTLHGEKTIHSPASRNLSPKKPPPGTNARKRGKATHQAEQHGERSTPRVHEEGHRIPINSIYSKQCVEKARDLYLVWDLKDQVYFVERAGRNVRLPNRNVLVAIGERDVKNWFAAKELTKVHITGPMTSISTGRILIDFFDEAGMHDCHHQLCAANSVETQWDRTPGEMNKLFTVQSPKLEEAHERLRRAAVDAQPLPPQTQRAGSHRSETEEILYEDDHPAEASAPLKMLEAQRRRRENPTSSETTSRYFDGMEPPRKSDRVSRAPTTKPKSPTPQPKWTAENDLPAWPSMVYPAQGVRRVTVERDDIKRLDEEEFLNDNLVSFAMRHIEENMDPKHKDKVYCFNTFFYTTLNRKKGKNRLDYQAVERWTKGVDLFSKDYVVVPINAHLHWFVAIICNLPNLNRRLVGSDEEDGTDQDAHTPRTEPAQTELEITGSRSTAPEATAQAEIIDAEHDSDLDPTARGSHVFEIDDQGVVISPAQVDETLETRRPITKKGGKKSRPAPPARKYDVSQPVIITLDSLGAAHSTEIRTLKEYISAEANGKRSMHVDTSQLSGITAKGIPEQPNYCDCGVYVIGYLMEFAKDPDKFIHKILRKEMKHEDFSDFKAPETRNEIRRNILELGDEQQRQRLLHKKAKKATKTKASSPDAGSHKPLSSHPASSALPALNSPPPQATQSSAVVEPPTTPCRSPVQTASSKPVEADNDHLDFSPPKILAGPQTRQESRPLPSNDNEDEDMLDHGGMSSALPDAPHSDASSSTTTDSGSKSSLLDTFKNYVKEAGEAAHRNAVVATQHNSKPASTDDGQEESEPEPEPEIAESQESHTGQAWAGKRTTFDG